MGLCSGKMRSTPTPLEILRTVNAALTPTATTRDAHTLERLNALLFPFLHAHVHADGITGAERREVVAEPLFLGFDEGMHMTLGAEARLRLNW